jgi:hypothetical protein
VVDGVRVGRRRGEPGRQPTRRSTRAGVAGAALRERRPARRSEAGRSQMAPTRGYRIAAGASAWMVEAKAFEMDDLEQPRWKRPRCLLCPAIASVSADRIDAPESSRAVISAWLLDCRRTDSLGSLVRGSGGPTRPVCRRWLRLRGSRQRSYPAWLQRPAKRVPDRAEAATRRRVVSPETAPYAKPVLCGGGGRAFGDLRGSSGCRERSAALRRVDRDPLEAGTSDEWERLS